jgi:hypothetical protein
MSTKVTVDLESILALLQTAQLADNVDQATEVKRAAAAEVKRIRDSYHVVLARHRVMFEAMTTIQDTLRRILKLRARDKATADDLAQAALRTIDQAFK